MLLLHIVLLKIFELMIQLLGCFDGLLDLINAQGSNQSVENDKLNSILDSFDESLLRFKGLNNKIFGGDLHIGIRNTKVDLCLEDVCLIPAPDEPTLHHFLIPQ